MYKQMVSEHSIQNTLRVSNTNTHTHSLAVFKYQECLTFSFMAQTHGGLMKSVCLAFRWGWLAMGEDEWAQCTITVADSTTHKYDLTSRQWWWRFHTQSDHKERWEPAHILSISTLHNIKTTIEKKRDMGENYQRSSRSTSPINMSRCLEMLLNQAVAAAT